MKKTDEVLALFHKYLDNSCNAEETQRVMEFFHNERDMDRLNAAIVEVLAEVGSEYETDPLVEDVVSRVDRDLFIHVRSRRFKLWPWISVAAAILLIVFGIRLFSVQTDKVAAPQSVVAEDVAPGTVGATLTLANGKKIRLADVAAGTLANESGIVISKNEEGMLVYEIRDVVSDPDAVNVLSTDKGQTSRVLLPDGSVVYLNAASSLTYTTSLMRGGKREVMLSGEGYFEIAKDRQHPFVVKTAKQEVEVLGTHFNISSYFDDASERTTLLEGRVKVSASGHFRVLEPGQQSRLTKDKLMVSETDTDLAVAWKNNEFVFDSQTIEEVMKMVERWYNVEVVFVGEKTSERFSGGVSRFDNVSKVLEMIESTGASHFRIEGRKIYVQN
ncbi:FecR family protein [Pedobacter deserti]|uniref:FecR family protein n=1 Tax=Pedobacter deserti TaxID=2817382 RepID=UPI0021092AE9|nr:FecR domain-containing protein [Pedobacter sp. SYSU D00382]